MVIIYIYLCYVKVSSKDKKPMIPHMCTILAEKSIIFIDDITCFDIGIQNHVLGICT